eukprot:Nitzschia sp. Nitz4//scaffold362_size15054//4876//6189//NITZ4_008899-RA/size15054-processed-gene-0.2-mRNA-1//1//CDS//3329549241//724//frame0
MQTLNEEDSTYSLVTLAGVAATAFCGGGLLTIAALKASGLVSFHKWESGVFPATQTDGRAIAPKPSSTKHHIYPYYDYWNKPKESFASICDMLMQEFIQDDLPNHYNVGPIEISWLEKVMEETVKGGKMYRGLMVVETGVALLGLKSGDDSPKTQTTLVRLAILGWAIEWVQAAFLVADDIMDASTVRRGKPCWYKTLGDAWYIAINDVITLESMTYRILRKHFSYDHKVLLGLMDLFSETMLQTELGQLGDILCDTLDLPDLTPDRWEWIVAYKTSYYSFYLSVACAMILAGIDDVEVYDAARDILVPMGVYFTAQDDYYDCYPTPERADKVGTDIESKKCSWLFVKAYHQLASPEQKAYLDQYYGKCKVGSHEEAKIKAIYTELGLPSLYEKYEQDSFEEIIAMKNGKPGAILEEAGVPWVIFESFLKKIYKRSL